MPWQFYISIYFVFAVSHSLLTRWFSQKSALPSKVIASLSYGLGVLPVGLIVGFSGAERTYDWNGFSIFLLATIGAFIALFGWFSFESKKLVTVTNYLTLFQIYAVVVAILGWVLLGERLRGIQFIGGALLLGGSYMAIYSVKRKKNGTSSLKGSILAGLAGTALGVVLIAEKAALDRFSLAAYFIVGYGVQALATSLLALTDYKNVKMRDFTRFEIFGSIACGLLAALGGYTYIMTLSKVDNISLVVLLTTFQMPLSVIASHFILGEKDNGKLLLLAGATSFLGLILMA